MANLTTGNWTATAGTNTCNGLALTTNTTDYTIPNGVTVTLVAANTVVARSLTIAAGGTLIFAATTSVINMGDTAGGTGGAGNVALSVDAGATVTLTGIGTINFVTTIGTQQTITTGGKTMPNITINGVVGSSYLQADALTSSGTLSISQGTYSTGNNAISATVLASTSSSARTISLGSSAITLSATATALTIQNAGSLTMTTNTSVITATNGSTTVLSNVSQDMKGASLVLPGGGGSPILFGGIWKDITRTGTAVKTDGLIISSDVVCTGTFTITGNSLTNRLIVQSLTLGTPRTITAAATAFTNVDFMDTTFVTAGSIYLVSDSFNRSNGSLGTSDSAYGGTNTAWTGATGTWAIASNAVVAPATGGSIGLAVGATDMRVSAKLTANSPNSGDSTIICARYTDFNNSLMLFCYPTGSVTLYSKVAGSYTNVATMTGTFAAGDVLSLQIVGLNYMVLKNGASMGTGVVPSTILNGVTNAGIGFNGSGGASVIIDDFKVQATIATGTSIGDALGNTNLSATTAVTRYGVVAGSWSSTATWSATSGGAGGASVPLPQDNVFLNASSAAGTYTVDMPRACKDLNCTGFTRTLATSLSLAIYGSLLFVPGMTYSSANGMSFAGRGNHTVTMAGKAVGTGATIAGFGGTYTQQDDFTWFSGSNTVHTAGTWVSNNFAMTGGGFITNGAIARALTLGTSTVSLASTSGNVWAAAAGLTLSAASATFVLGTISGSSRTFAGGGLTYGTLTYTVANSAGTIVISGANTFNTLNIGSGRTLSLTSGTTQTVTNWNVNGTNNGYQYIPGLQTGTPGVAVWAPDALPIRLTSSFTMDVKFLPNVTGTNTWAGNGTIALAYKTNSGLTQGYGMRMTNTGALTAHIGGVGSVSPATMGSVFADGTPGWVRVVWNDATDQTTWFTSPDGTTWTSMGAAQAHVSAGIVDSGTPLYIGSRQTGNDAFIGRMYRVRIYSDTTQTTKVFDADFSTKTFGANTFAESSTNAATVTIEGDIDKVGDGRVSIISTTPASAATLSKASGTAASIYLVVQDSTATGGATWYAGRSSSVSGNTGWTFADAPGRYWVGGSGNWNSTGWATTSGGPTGAAAPTAADDVFLDASSGAVTVTIPAATTVLGRSLDCTGFTGGTLVFAATTSILTLGDATAGNGNNALKFISGMALTLTGAGIINLISTSATQQTITTAGKILPSVTFNSLGSSYVLSDPLTLSNSAGQLTITQGRFDTGNFAVSCWLFTTTGALTRRVSFGSSSITMAYVSTNSFTISGSNLTVDANTATLNFSSLNAGTNVPTAFDMGGCSIIFTPGAVSGQAMNGGIWKNITITGPATKTYAFAFMTSVICTGTLTINGNTVTNRVLVQSSAVGTTAAVSAATVTVTNADFMDIAMTGNVGAISTSDSFNRANGSLNGSTTDVAAGGTGFVWGTPTQAGTWNITTNQVVPTYATVTPPSVVPLPVALADVRISTVLVTIPTGGNGLGGLVARYVDANNYMTAMVTQSGTVHIGGAISGTYTSNSVVSSVAIGLIVNDIIGLEVNGYAVSLYKNNVLFSSYALTSAQAAAWTGTSVGLAAAGAGGAKFDDFKVYPMSPWNLSAVSGGSGDGQGNSGITFTTPVTRYGVVAGNWSSTAMWSASSGGAGGATVPLPQDNVILNVSSAAGTYITDMPRACNNFTCTGFTRTLQVSSTYAIYGNIVLGSGMTIGSSQSLECRGRGAQTIQSNGVTYAGSNTSRFLAIYAPGGSYTLQDAWTSGLGISHQNGAFNANGFNVTVAFYNGSTNTRTLTMGTGTWTMDTASVAIPWALVATGLTLSAASSTIVISGAGASTRAFQGGGLTYGTLQYDVAASTGQLTISGNNTFNRVQFGTGRTIANTAGAIQTVLDGASSTMSGAVNGYYRSPGLSANYATSPDSAALSITGDIDIRVRLTLDAWTQTNAMILAKNLTASTGLSYRLSMNSTGGGLAWNISSNGTTATTAVSAGAVPFSGGTVCWIRVAWRASDGRTQFFTAPDSSSMPSSWNQLGGNVTANIGSIFDSTSDLEIGNMAGGTSSAPATGNFYRAQIRNNILDDGTGIQFDADFTAKAFGANSFTEANGATVTITGATAQAGDGRLALTSTTGGTASYWAMFGAPAIMDYLSVQDIYSSEPYKFYAGTHSTIVSGVTNVALTAPVTQPYLYSEIELTGSGTTNNVTLPGGLVASANQLLVIVVSFIGTPGVVTTPVGWTLVSTTTDAGPTTSVFYKVAVGGETTVTIANTTSVATINFKLMQYAGFLGTPTYDGKDSAVLGGSNATSMTTGAGVTNSGNPGLAIASWGGVSSFGATISLSNSYQISRQATEATILRVGVLPLSSNASQTSTLTWTTTKARAIGQLVLFKDVGGGGGYRLLLGVGS